MTVREVLRTKGGDVYAVGPGQSVFDALQLMADRNIGAVLVVEGARTLGIFTERDYSRQVVLKGRASKDTPVRDVMTARVVYVTPDRTMDDCMALMTSKRCRHLPVVEDGRLAGVLSIGDVVKAVISDKQFLIDQLENYITSGG
ncbi:MAG TPA: CBS domain-containing protein [Vicinamibacterales bacterium]|nr:CBS domain-containing protein [Vicinamibacterales bacterium]